MRSVFLLLICIFLYGISSAQSKKEGRKSQKTEGSTEGLNPGAPSIQAAPADEKKTKQQEEEYVYVVIVNTSDPDAHRQWEEIPGKFAGVKTESLGGQPGLYLLVTRNPELALFQKAYASSFRIFKESELEYFGNVLPCLAELRPRVASMGKKLSGQ